MKLSQLQKLSLYLIVIIIITNISFLMIGCNPTNIKTQNQKNLIVAINLYNNLYQDYQATYDTSDTKILILKYDLLHRSRLAIDTYIGIIDNGLVPTLLDEQKLLNIIMELKSILK